MKTYAELGYLYDKMRCRDVSVWVSEELLVCEVDGSEFEIKSRY